MTKIEELIQKYTIKKNTIHALINGAKENDNIDNELVADRFLNEFLNDLKSLNND
jgi:hypothetical protein